MGQRNEPLHVVLFAQERRVAIHSKLPSQTFGGTAVRPVADHIQFRRDFLADLGQNPDAVEDSLHGTEVRDMNEPLDARAPL